MKTWLLLGLPFACLTLSHAQNTTPLPDRGDLYAWNVGSLTTGRGPSAGYWNPALWGVSRSNDLEFIWSGEGKDHPQHKEQGFFLNMEGLGFGVVHQEDSLGTKSMNHYRLGVGFGEKGNYSGVSYAWSRGTWDAQGLPDHLVFSSINQLNRYVSLGTGATYALGKTYHGVPWLLEAGLGLRPFWDRATFTLDGAWPSDRDAIKWDQDRYWVGVELEPVDHVRISARQRVNLGGDNNFQEDLTVQAGLYLKGFGFSSILPSAEDDALEPGVRHGILLSDRNFTKGLPFGHKKQLFARVELGGTAGEYPWLMVGQKFRLYPFLKQMDAAEKNPRLKGLFLDIKPDFAADIVMLREIRERVKLYKERTGGEVAVYAHGYSMPLLYLASIADRRAMLTVGSAQIDNIGRERTYMGDAFEEAGIDFVRFNIGAYKGAGEDYDKNAMSATVRENVGLVMRDLYQSLSDGVKEGYGFDDAQMAQITGKWFITKDDMLKMKLVDTLLFDDQVEDWVCRRESSDDDDEKSTHGISLSLNFGFSSSKLEKLKGDHVVSLASLQERPAIRRWGVKDEVAVVYASGPIYTGRSIGPLVIGNETLVKQFKALRADDNVKAVVFHIDSPGGDGYACDLMWREMHLLAKKKPIIVVQGQYAASGGYYLSMPGDTILSTPVTITGSIGVAAGLFIDKGLMDNSKLRQDGVWAGKEDSFGGTMVLAPLSIKAGSAQFQLPTIPVFGRPLTPYQTEELQGMIKDFYQDFVQKVADDRGKSWDEIHAVAEGRVWSGPRAQERGLVDGQGGLQDAIRIAMHRAGLKEENVKVREVHPDLSFQDLMLLMGGMGQGMSLKGSMDHMLADRLNFSQDLRVQILGSGKPELLMDDQILGVQPR